MSLLSRLAILTVRPKDADHTVHRIILGTHTSGQASDHLMIAEVVLPKSPLESNGAEVADLYDEEKGGESHIYARDGA